MNAGGFRRLPFLSLPPGGKVAPKGPDFIRKNAEAYPHINFVGIERNLSVVAVAARRTTEELPNLALVWDDAKKLSDFFEVGEFQRLYLNFSDPWPKKRQYKRRLTYRGYLQSYREAFGDKGEIFFKTDNRNWI